MPITPEDRAHAQDLLNFIDASPSPWHAVLSITQRLQAQGFVHLQEKLRWKLETGKGYYVVRGASLIAFRIGQQPLPETGFRMVGAHTDSPGLRLKTNAAHASDGVVRLGVEIYGGPILATFTDRDLSLAGRVNVRTAHEFETRLINFELPLLRLPNLAIHMNREVNEQGLKLNKQTELPLLFAIADNKLSAREQFLNLVADELKVKAPDILTYELTVCDTQAGAFWGAEQAFIASSQLDNLASCHAALTALLASPAPAATCIAAFFDHEEVGSESAAGAGGSFAGDVVERISLCMELDDEQQHCAAAHSFFISADMAHAYQPNFPNAYEPNHRVMVNAGPVIKTNANQRYSTDADTAARFITLCESAGVPYQNYTHRTDLGCGSTIGPIVAASLGIASVDVGSPMWAMHSLRESAGVQDVAYMIKAMKAAFSSWGSEGP
ncbi:putative M18 family aminopeptidase 2 [Candidatus Nitrotoga sp. BS]|uniref:M18 family aminopeptidase n=1 Tax=Candidatus Nitrotoga sp. BS TaxID=2890408 RepID=UPI001EF24C12|nr:M18 family aminopeptidase [Candidatus Nitrotoga sp. BS]CAH1195008.1 putative M18 family aminopeptidase 2 [Candidatus Nitrotoga sp. BS]